MPPPCGPLLAALRKAPPIPYITKHESSTTDLKETALPPVTVTSMVLVVYQQIWEESAKAQQEEENAGHLRRTGEVSFPSLKIPLKCFRVARHIESKMGKGMCSDVGQKGEIRAQHAAHPDPAPIPIPIPTRPTRQSKPKKGFPYFGLELADGVTFQATFGCFIPTPIPVPIPAPRPAHTCCHSSPPQG